MVQHPRLAVTRPTYIATDAVPFPEISIQLFPIGVNKKGAVRTLARRQKAGTNPPTVGRHATSISSKGASAFHASIPQTASESYPWQYALFMGEEKQENGKWRNIRSWPSRNQRTWLGCCAIFYPYDSIGCRRGQPHIRAGPGSQPGRRRH